MSLARLSTKGQLIVPKEIRDRHGWHAGTQLELVDSAQSLIIRSPKPFPVTNLRDGVGMLRSTVGLLSVDEMNEAVDKMFADDPAWKGTADAAD